MTNGRDRTLNRAFVAGTAGGVMEVLWIGLVAAVLGVDAWQVARGVTITVAPGAAASVLAPWAGLAIHFLLSAALALVFARLVANRLRGAPLLLAAVAALAAVWAFNFFVLLPWLNPGFTALLPYPVTLVSKLLFGLAMAFVLDRGPETAR